MATGHLRTARTIRWPTWEIDIANTRNQASARFFSYLYTRKQPAGTVHRTVPTPGRYVGLPGKIDNANRLLVLKFRGFFLHILESASRTSGIMRWLIFGKNGVSIYFVTFLYILVLDILDI